MNKVRYIFLITLLPIFSTGQNTILTHLKIKVHPGESIDSVKFKYFENKNDQSNLYIPFSTMYRFYPEPIDSARSFNFNIDSNRKVTSIVIVSGIDNRYFGKIKMYLGKPSHKLAAGNPGGITSSNLFWNKYPYDIEMVTFYNKEFLIIHHSGGSAKDFYKFKVSK